MASIREIITRAYNGKTITIFTDCQAVFKGLESVTVKPKLVFESLGHLDELATHNSVQLVWVPGHEGILGNERTEKLAKKGADTPFTGPGPYLAYRTAWSSEQSGTGWRGNTQSDGSLAKTASTPRPSWQDLNKAGLLNC
jgi:Ribonuclease HI